jgi:organic hydroperoxide reductase OsmC/OhrA
MHAPFIVESTKDPRMPLRQSTAVWKGNLKQGKGTVKLGSGAFEGQYSFGTRFEEGKGTNPEELIATAEAGCFPWRFRLAWANPGSRPTAFRPLRERASTSKVKASPSRASI